MPEGPTNESTVDPFSAGLTEGITSKDHQTLQPIDKTHDKILSSVL